MNADILRIAALKLQRDLGAPRYSRLDPQARDELSRLAAVLLDLADDDDATGAMLVAIDLPAPDPHAVYLRPEWWSACNG